MVAVRTPPTDLADLWRNAIEQYNSHISDEKGLKKIEQDWSNMVTSLEDVEKEVRDDAKGFLHKRHSGSRGDGLRASIRKNLGIAQFIGDQVAKAVSTSFPAASPIWTVATFAIQTAQKVSADYDRVQQLFVEMGDFLKTVKILEKRVPDNTSFTQHLTDIMESLLIVFAVHTKYMKQGRALKFLSSIFGDDDELGKAYANVTKALDKLTSATSTMALRNTQDIKDFLADNRDQVERMEIQLTSRMNELNEKSDLMIQQQTTIQEYMQDSFQTQIEGQQRIEKMLEEKLLKRKNPGLSSQAGQQSQAQAKDPAAGKSAAFNKVQAWCSANIAGYEKNPMQLVRKFGRSYVDTKYSWFFHHDTYKSWSACQSDNSVLLLRGLPGVGKSTLSQFVFSRLGAASHSLSARFHFQEAEKSSQSIKNCLVCLVLQLAQKNSAYCEQIASLLKEGNKLYGIPEDIEVLWNELFRKRFSPRAEDSVFLILDGLDELPKQEFKKLIQLLSSVAKDKLKIRVLLASRPGVAALDTLHPTEIEMSRSDLKKDMSALASERCNTLARIRRFPKRIKQIIRAKVTEKADGMLYVDLALHHLDSIGREGLARKVLDKFPSNLSDLFKHIISELYHSRPSKDQQAIRTLYTWLIYAKRPLSIAEANQLVSLSATDRIFKVEDEVQGQSSRLLDLAHNDDVDSEDGEADEPLDEDSSLDEDHDDHNDDVSGSLYFQDKAFRDFLKEQQSQTGGLVETQNAAHLTILNASISVLCSQVKTEVDSESGNGARTDSKENNGLLEYASCYWDWHFLQVTLNDATEGQVCRVIRLLSQIFQNTNNALGKIEESGRFHELSETYNPCPAITKSAFERIPAWLERAERVVSMIEPNVAEWLRRFQSNPKTCLQDLLRSHGQNCYETHSSSRAYRAFRMAFQTLQLLENTSKESANDDSLSPERIRQVFNTFNRTDDDFKFHRALSAVYGQTKHQKLAAEECENALKFVSPDKDRFSVLGHRAAIGLRIFEASPDGDGMEVLDQAHSYSIEAFAMLDSIFTKPYLDDDKGLIFDCWYTRAQIEAKLDLHEEAIKSYDESADLLPWTRPFFLDDIFDVLEKQKDYKGIITRLGSTNAEHQMIFILNNLDNGSQRIQKAAKEVGDEGISTVVRLYNRVIEYFDRSKKSGSIRLRLAFLYRRIVENSSAAKEVLIKILDSDGCKPLRGQSDDVFTLITARFYYAEILYEDFVSSHDPSHKAALLAELKELPEKQLGKSLELDFERSSNTTIMLARMLLKLGPAQEYYDVMQSMFDICYKGLTDTTSSNDVASLRLFARLLALAGLHEDAQIAYSAQFYKLDSEEDSEDADTDASNESSTPEPASDLTNGVPSDTFTISDNPSKKTDSPNSELDSDPSPDGGVLCEGCFTFFSDLSTPLYLCAICASCDLCPGCYEKRQARNKGAPNDSWKEYCGRDHAYIKGPVEGWRGIKRGVMRIERVGRKGGNTEGQRRETTEKGNIELEEIEFKQWLKELKEGRWAEMWKKWWAG
ncbi:MAG: hypothetical protein M1822_006954 [Bathelium mastoideum]|nr:MAG: hypothetical protein M1822_006954 [Bathelium mastoideum]